MDSPLLNNREIIIEFHPIGAFVKVTAMDVKTITEVSIQGPATAPENLLKRNAMKRLEFVMKKKGLI
jgi:hypothetical protein